MAAFSTGCPSQSTHSRNNDDATFKRLSLPHAHCLDAVARPGLTDILLAMVHRMESDDRCLGGTGRDHGPGRRDTTTTCSPHRHAASTFQHRANLEWPAGSIKPQHSAGLD